MRSIWLGLSCRRSGPSLMMSSPRPRDINVRPKTFRPSLDLVADQALAVRQSRTAHATHTNPCITASPKPHYGVHRLGEHPLATTNGGGPAKRRRSRWCVQPRRRTWMIRRSRSGREGCTNGRACRSWGHSPRRKSACCPAAACQMASRRGRLEPRGDSTAALSAGGLRPCIASARRCERTKIVWPLPLRLKHLQV